MKIEDKINYYKSKSVAKKLVEKKLITQQQSDRILDYLKSIYNMKEKLDKEYIYDI